MYKAHMDNGQNISITDNEFTQCMANLNGETKWFGTDNHYFQLSHVVDFELVMEDDQGKIIKPMSPGEYKNYQQRQQAKAELTTKEILDDAKASLSDMPQE